MALDDVTDERIFRQCRNRYQISLLVLGGPPNGTHDNAIPRRDIIWYALKIFRRRLVLRKHSLKRRRWKEVWDDAVALFNQFPHFQKLPFRASFPTQIQRRSRTNFSSHLQALKIANGDVNDLLL